ncbi:MAG: tRNA pseudouridine(55) synthase TruB [Weeping tea tree witches'-broom phytoplasma]|uniref:tRNA pseudouridine(55) synthase TruB n=1 Tax=Candidatus Phytoplasma melaleucae TaxID=2982630 RepID=UPI0029399061|nr:tRNA pseudouridine(55) synthase TruB [Weeping tea tree witches'-broom phytoplasma]
MEGFLLVYKDSGQTSHDVVHQIKKKFSFVKTGHTGTLDPLAEGLLIVLVNRATKLAFLFENLAKIYKGDIVFNHNYDTLDVTGRLIESKDIKLNVEVIQQSFMFFDKKSYWQVPPMYSAIKVQGTRMYHLAKKNVQIELTPRKVNIFSLNIISNDLSNNQVTFEANVSKGTYIRSLARDIGFRMNTYGALKTLIRTQIGSYHVQKAKNIHQISLADLIEIKTLFAHYPKIVLADYLIRLIQNGFYLDQRHITISKAFIVLNQYNKWIAYYEPINRFQYRPRYFFLV